MLKLVIKALNVPVLCLLNTMHGQFSDLIHATVSGIAVHQHLCNIATRSLGR